MSKTAQRKRSAYQEGYHDGRRGHYFRWVRHPYMTHYKQGYAAGRAERHGVPKNVEVLVKLLEVIHPTAQVDPLKRSRGKGRGRPSFYPREF